MASEDIQARAARACMRYLAMAGYEILEGDFEGFIVARDEEGVAFVGVEAKRGYFDSFGNDDAGDLLKSFEKAIVDYFVSEDAEPDVRVRLDKISVSVVADDKAVLKHHTNVCIEK